MTFQDADDDEMPTGVDVLREDAVDLSDVPAMATFGHYDLLGRLGVGGMAEIMLARDRAGSARVRHLVIKCLPEELADEAQAVVMFLDEARVANRLYHPNVCHVYEWGEVDGTYYMAMEWVHGASLRRVIRRAASTRAFPIAVAVHIGANVARALHYVHQAKGEGGRPMNIVHRDVSPQNVMISWSGRVKLLDFGIAKSAEQYGRTRAGVVKGKYAYMAPEQCRAEAVDARTDVFALGTCLFEMLTLRPLFHRDNVLATMKAVTSFEPPLVHEVRPDVPAELSAIVARALEKDPAQRWQSAGELRDELEGLLVRHGVSVRAKEVVDYLSAIFTDADRIPLPPPARQTGSHRSGLITGAGPFGQVDDIGPPHVPIEVVSPASSAPPARSEPRPWVLFLLTFVVTALLTGLVLWLSGQM